MPCLPACCLLACLPCPAWPCLPAPPPPQVPPESSTWAHRSKQCLLRMMALMCYSRGSLQLEDVADMVQLMVQVG